MTHRDDELSNLNTDNVPENCRQDHGQTWQRSMGTMLTLSMLIKLSLNVFLVFQAF